MKTSGTLVSMFFLENINPSRTEDLVDSYYISTTSKDQITFEGVIDVNREALDQTTVDLYAMSEDELYAEFLGGYTVNDSLVVMDVMIGDTTYVFYADPSMARQPGEKYKDCIKREYKTMKEAYEARPLDDIACTLIAGGLLCKTLAIIVAASECTKYEK